MLSLPVQDVPRPRICTLPITPELRCPPTASPDFAVDIRRTAGDPHPAAGDRRHRSRDVPASASDGRAGQIDGTVRMDPSPPSAPTLSPISRPTGIATINAAGTAPRIWPRDDADLRGRSVAASLASTAVRQRRRCASGDGPGTHAHYGFSFAQFTEPPKSDARPCRPRTTADTVPSHRRRQHRLPPEAQDRRRCPAAVAPSRRMRPANGAGMD